jgi:hypothetical protein
MMVDTTYHDQDMKANLLLRWRKLRDQATSDFKKTEKKVGAYFELLEFLNVKKKRDTLTASRVSFKHFGADRPIEVIEKYRLLKDLSTRINTKTSILETKVAAGQVIDSASFDQDFQ